MTLQGRLSGQLVLGLILFLASGAALFFLALNAPPALDELLQVDISVSGPAYIARPGRGSAYAVIPLGGVRGEVHNICPFGDCVVPGSLAGLQPGAIIRVWLADKVIWQLEYQGHMAVNYAEVRADYAHTRHWNIGLALLVLGSGGLLIWWGLHPAPYDLGFGITGD